MSSLYDNHYNLCSSSEPPLLNLTAAEAQFPGRPHSLCGSAPPLNLVMLRRGEALVPGVSLGAAQRRAWAAVGRALEKREHHPSFALRVLALGGSLLAGSDCVDGVHPAFSPACAYPKRLAGALQALYGAAVDWVSIATGGLTTSGALSSLPSLLAPYAPPASPDTNSSHGARGLPTILVLDYSVNDALEGERRKAATLAALESLVRYMCAATPRPNQT